MEKVLYVQDNFVDDCQNPTVYPFGDWGCHDSKVGGLTPAKLNHQCRDERRMLKILILG
jgi:hypothetical protein